MGRLQTFVHAMRIYFVYFSNAVIGGITFCNEKWIEYLMYYFSRQTRARNCTIAARGRTTPRRVVERYVYKSWFHRRALLSDLKKILKRRSDATFLVKRLRCRK